MRDWKKKLVKSIDKKPSNPIGITKEENWWLLKKNINKKVINEKPLNLISNLREKLTFYKWSMKSESIEPGF